MKIHLIAIGQRMPDWVEKGVNEYVTRMPRECTLNLVEVPAGKRGKTADLNRIKHDEGERLLAAVPKGCRVLVLDIGGRGWSTQQLATQMQHWMQSGQDIALLVGGPEGLSEKCLQQAEQTWSLSNLTLPHPLVRIVVAEQIYRAWSLIHNHPYHR